MDVPAALVGLPGLAYLVREDLCHRKFALADQFGVPLRTGDTELEDIPRTRGEAPVAKVETKEICIGWQWKSFRVS
jgi:hypothetical protein